MSADHTPEPTRPRRRGLTTVSVALAVLLAGGGGAYWASTASGGGGAPDAARDGAGAEPSPLVLDGYGESRAATAERGIAQGEPAPGGGPVYKAAEPLPKGPGSAPAYRPAADVDRKRVAGLAEALDVPGEIRREDGTWTVGGEGDRGSGTLTVDAATGVWSFSGAVPLEAGDVSEEEAKKAAAPVVAALGFEGAEVDAGQERGGLRIVRIDPRQDGLPVHGWTTELGVGHRGAPASGNGKLAELAKAGRGAEYPVMNAEDTLAALNERSGRVDLGLKCAAPPEKGAWKPGTVPAVPPADGEPGGPGPCGPAGERRTVEVTGASFGLSAYLSQGRDLLVPSWLFEVAEPGSEPYTVAHPAVEPEFLASPSSTGGDGDGATSGPADPDRSPGEPVRTATHVEEYEPGDRTLTVHFWGGVCSEYEATAEESAETVRVLITERPEEPGKACILVAKEMTVEVTLDEPAGDRKILDEEGERLPEGAERARDAEEPRR